MHRTVSLIGLAAVLALTVTAGALGADPDALALGLDALGSDMGLTLDPALGAIAFGGLIVNASTLSNLYTGFKAHFQKGAALAEPQWSQVATVVPSTTKTEEYGWLGNMPSVRKWVGDRIVHNLSVHKYSVTNADYELTIGVDRNDIEDDNLGVYGPMFQNIGHSTARHRDEEVFSVLARAWDTPCYDGQPMIDADHPVIAPDGSVVSKSNNGGGAGAPWFLMDLRQPLKPIIVQERKSFDFVAMTSPTDENVFMRREYVYGVHGRSAVGFGFWQQIYGSRQTLDVTAFAGGFEALETMAGDHGQKLGIRPSHLLVPPSLRVKAQEIVKVSRLSNGADNPWHGVVDVIVCPWL